MHFKGEENLNNSKAGIKGQAKRYQRMLSGWAHAVVEEALPHKQDFTGMQVAQLSSFCLQHKQPVGLEGSGSKNRRAGSLHSLQASQHSSRHTVSCASSPWEVSRIPRYMHLICMGFLIVWYIGTQLIRLRWQWAKFGVWRGAVCCSISTRSCTPQLPRSFSLCFQPGFPLANSALVPSFASGRGEFPALTSISAQVFTQVWQQGTKWCRRGAPVTSVMCPLSCWGSTGSWLGLQVSTLSITSPSSSKKSIWVCQAIHDPLCLVAISIYSISLKF